MNSQLCAARLAVRLQLICVLTAVMVFPPAWAMAAGPTTAITFDDINRAWKDREGRLNTAVAEWKEQVFHPRGSLIRSPRSAPPGDVLEPLPPEDTRVEIRCRLLLSGFESRFERNGPLWSYDHASFYPRDFVSVFGRREQGQYFSEVPKRHVPMAMMGRSDNSPHAHDLSAFPVSFAVRPVELRLRRPRAEGWQLDAAGVRMHGRPCVSLVHHEARYNGSSAPGTYLMQIWVDQERDFALVQYEEGEDGHVYFHSELENEQHSSGEWLPARWQTSFFRAVEPYELTQHTQVDQVAWQFGEPTPDDTFLVPRPPRTWVTGEPGGEYVVLAGGAKRMVKPTLCWLAVLALGGLSFWAGMAQAACTNDCFPANGSCVYNGTTGQILRVTSDCPLKVWASVSGSPGNCNGVRTCGALTCVGGDGTYCHAPASGEYAFMNGGCSTCSGSTTFSGCNTCS